MKIFKKFFNFFLILIRLFLETLLKRLKGFNFYVFFQIKYALIIIIIIIIYFLALRKKSWHTVSLKITRIELYILTKTDFAILHFIAMTTKYFDHIL
jgi:hypothetical protein